MRDQVRHHKEKAAGFLAKRKYKAAIKQYRSALQIAPDAVDVRQKLGEVLARTGAVPEAISEYQHVAGRYAADGFLLKAMAICKVILQLDPRHTETQATLAELYASHHGPSSEMQLPPSMSGAIRPGAGPGRRLGPGLTVTPARKSPPAASPPPGSESTASRPTPPPVPRSDEGGLDGRPSDPVPVETLRATSTAVAPLGVDDDTVDNSVKIELEILEVHAAEDFVDESTDTDLDDDEEERLADARAIQAARERAAAEAAEIDAQFARATAPTETATPRLPTIPLFSQLDPKSFVAVFERLEMRTVPAGARLVTEGNRGRSMFIVVQGEVAVFREPVAADGGGERRHLATMLDGAFFGEMALLSDAQRLASVEATQPSILLVLDRETLADIAQDHPSVAEIALSFYKSRLLANLLRSSPIFQPLSEAQQQALIDQFQSATAQPGMVLLTKGQKGDGLYLLLRGTCEAFDVAPDGTVANYPDLVEGDLFGEISLLLDRPVTATVRAKTTCLVLRLERELFYRDVMSHPEVRKMITELTNERLRRTATLLQGPRANPAHLV